MIVLREFKLWQKLLGLNSSGLISVLLRIIHLSLLFSLDLMISLVFFVNFRGDLYQALATIPTVITTALFMANYLHLIISREHIHSLVVGLQDIVDESEKKGRNEWNYATAEKKTSFISKIMICGTLSTHILIMSPFIQVAYHWSFGQYTIDSWFYLYPVWTPFELNTTLRCASMVLFQSMSFTSADLVFCSVPFLLIGLVAHSEACFMDIELLISRLDRLSRCDSSDQFEPRKTNPLKGSSSQSSARINNLSQGKSLEWEMLEICKEAVDLHRKVIRLLHDLADVLNTFILETLLLLAIGTCVALLIIVKYRGTNYLYDLQLPMLFVIFPLILFAVIFYIGQIFNSTALKLSLTIYQSYWYRYPCTVQRSMLFMMMRSQQSFHLSAYGLMELNLENFVVLLKRMYSAVMVLRSMD